MVLVTVSECGSAISFNNTYITNPNYPGKYAANEECTYTLNKASEDICYIRVEMIENHVSFGINDDASFFNGVCDTDNIETSCRDGTNFPVEFCGDNSGQHGRY